MNEIPISRSEQKTTENPAVTGAFTVSMATDGTIRFTEVSFVYLLLLAVIYLAFISLGLPDSLLGSAWPTIRVDFGVPLSYMGMVSMIISGGTIISGLLSERLTKRFKTKTVTFVSVLLTAVALLGFYRYGILSDVPLGNSLRSGRRRY